MLTVDQVTVRFGSTIALNNVTLALQAGSVTAVLGPSGSGKSTLLRAIAGLQPITSGTISWDGENLAGVPAHLRSFGLMFQDYALFPHRTVAGNVGFGLRMRGEDPPAIAARVTEVLQWVDLDGFETRSVSTLSGGEQQRVALARALAPSPKFLMLDEPVGSLDRQLRTRLIDELRSLLRERHITALYVTHDQDEALALADQLIVMRAGVVAQAGTPAAIWSQPKDQWVARFLGFENVLDELAGVAAGPVVVHADAITIGEGPFPATVVAQRFHGSTVAVTIRLDTGVMLEAHVRGTIPAVGEATTISISPNGVVPVEASGG